MIDTAPPPVSRFPGRVDALDAARGLALATMAVYHFSWDLKWFGVVDWPVDSALGWRAFAMAIAASFLFLVGVGLALAYRGGLRPRHALRRVGRIALAAAAITLATYAALGDQFVRFGILHAIAAGSLLALPALRAPLWLVAGLALAALVLPHLVKLSFPGDAWLMWSGLVAAPPLSVDYVPLLPWIAPILAGIVAARVGLATGVVERLSHWSARSAPARLATLAGRHSLLVYLLHQPILFGLVWTAVSLGLTPDRTAATFVDQCVQSCTLTGEEAACRSTCTCTVEALQADGTWAALLDRPDDPALNDRLTERYRLCRDEAQ